MITQAYAATQPGGGDIFLQLLPFLLIFFIIYFLILRPQQKRVKTHKAMIDNLKKGDSVIVGGLIGKISKVMNEDEIWLRSNNGGLLRFNHQSGSVSRLKQDRDNGNALRDNRINFLYRDRAGAMWVSTSTMGISIYDPFYQKFGLNFLVYC